MFAEERNPKCVIERRRGTWLTMPSIPCACERAHPCYIFSVFRVFFPSQPKSRIDHVSLSDGLNNIQVHQKLNTSLEPSADLSCSPQDTQLKHTVNE